MNVLLENIPEALIAFLQWICWRYEERDDKKTKVLYSPRTGRRARTHDAAGKSYKDRAEDTWASYAEAVHASQHGCTQEGDRYDGIGFVFTEDDELAGLDLDGCIDGSGNVAAWAFDYICLLDSYSEVSPSGRGVKIIVQARKPEGRCRTTDLEFYDRHRFFAITGNRLPNTPPTVNARQGQYEQAWCKAFPPQQEAAPKQTASSAPTLSDEDILSKAFKASNSDKIRALMSGDTSAYGSNASRAEMALACFFAFYTDDADQLERLMRTSLLKRDKWEEARGAGTYLRNGVVEPALQKVTGKYHSGQHKSDPAEQGAVEEAGPLTPLHQLLNQIESQLRTKGITQTQTGPRFPPGLDREDLETIGKLLKRGEDYVTTFLNFLWGRWYESLPHKRHERGRIVETVFKGADGYVALSQMKRLSGFARVVRNIPVEHQRYNRRWSFYDNVADLNSPQRRLYWLTQQPRRGMMSEILAEVQAQNQSRKETQRPAPSQPPTSTLQAQDTASPSYSPSPVSIIHAEITQAQPVEAPPRGDTEFVFGAHARGTLRELEGLAGLSGLTLDDVLESLDVLRSFLESRTSTEKTDERPSSTHAAAESYFGHFRNNEVQTKRSGTGPVVLTATPTQLHHAEMVAEARKTGHDHCRRPSENCGGDAANRACDRYGAIGDTVVPDWLERNGHFPAYKLVTDRPSDKPDLMLYHSRIEIKTSPPDQFFAGANKRQVDAAAPDTLYLFCLFQDEQTIQLCAPVTRETVRSWEVYEGHSPFYSIRREHLTPLTSLEELIWTVRRVEYGPLFAALDMGDIPTEQMQVGGLRVDFAGYTGQLRKNFVSAEKGGVFASDPSGLYRELDKTFQAWRAWKQEAPAAFAQV
jgi:putative DNA primase/helicase